MRFHELGELDHPAILMIHGGGNSWWNYLRQARVLAEKYHVILPTLDGHGEESAIPYRSTEDSAAKLIQYVDQHCNGSLFALCGVSLGGQIVIEMLTQRPHLTRYAIIDGSLCLPQPRLARMSSITARLGWKLMFSPTSCRFQLAMMNRFFPEVQRFPEEIAAYYLEDMPKLPPATLMTIYQTYMKNYQLKEGLSQTSARILYWVGAKEIVFGYLAIIIIIAGAIVWLIFGKCPNCGKFLGRTNDKHCPHCGKRIEW